MKDFNALSGPWEGWSIQDGVRICERMRLTIRAGEIVGSGVDRDGEFELTGAFIARKQLVALTRRYTWTTEPSQAGVGIPYEYEGTWDGELVYGMWHPRMDPDYGGPFEMWPSRDEDRLALTIQFKEIAHT